jgi:hypothetical protein
VTALFDLVDKENLTMFGKKVIAALFLILGVILLVGCGPGESDGEPAAVPDTQTSDLQPTAVALTPEQTIEAFYDWYLSFMSDRSDGSFTNPLAEGLYRDSEYLTNDFVARIDETIAGFDGGGYDPILLAQDIPVDIDVQEPSAGSAQATVVVLRYWGGNPDPSPMVVHLIRQEGRWLIDNVTPFEVPAAEPAADLSTPAAVVSAFYGWYLDYIGDPASGEFRNPLVDKAYLEAPYLSASFAAHIDEQLEADRAEFGGITHDPILCAQDVPTQVTPGVTFERNGMASVVVSSSFANHMMAVDLRPEGESWLISNITCANGPAGVATVFYNWYLGYIGDRATGDFRNPLVDRAYAGHPLLDEALVAEVDALLASSDQGGYDPFLLAQDFPQDFSVDPGVAENTAVVHLPFSEVSVRHLLVTLDETGRKIRSISENELLPSSGPEAEPAGAELEMLFTSELYAFSFGYPAGWVVKELDVTGPGVPDDWPMVAAWLVMPAEVAEQLSAGGPPDPTAPVIVAPFQVEVVVGDEAAMERVYYNYPEGEAAVIGGREALVLQSDGYRHIVFVHPTRPNTWVVFTDWVTEFPGREAQAAVAEPVWQPLLESLQFAG